MAKVGRPGRRLVLSAEEQATLEAMARSHPKPHQRERASGLLKVAAGHSLTEVATTLLLRRRHPDTVGEWVRRYLAHGLGALYIQPGRGRKPVFSPLGA